MRFVVIAALLAGCPSSQDPAHGDDTATDAGAPDAAGPTCENPVPTCTQTITTHVANATSVTLRGDFATDGWTAGVPMTKNADGSWSATIPANDEQVVVYKLFADNQWIADPDNPRKSPDGYGAFNSVTRVDCDHCPRPAAFDWRDGIMYFILIDRFNDGDKANNAPVAGAEYPGQYQGGDFVGIAQKIEAGYFTDLGINTIWITSPLDNTHESYYGSDGHKYSGYHGYWPKDETKVDSHYGTEAELQAMVASAHAHGIKILIDYVMNHVTTDSPTYQQHNDWFWPDDNGSGGNCVCGQGCPTFNTVCWFDSFLPTFNMLDGDARNWSVSNAITWANTLGIDGFRLDAVKQVETVWFTDLRARANAELAWDQPFYMVGETFDGDRGLIKSYVDPDTKLTGQFDFPLRGQVLSTILRRDGQMSDLSGFLQSNDGFYGANAVMSTFLGNHDVPRAIGLADDSPLFGAWDGGKDRAWQNQPQLPNDANPFQRLAVAYTLLFTSPGLPMIYYGDEIGMPGAGDPDNRRFMQWDHWNANQTFLHDTLAKLAKVRSAHPATRRGTRTILGVTQDVMVYKMVADGDTIFVALNRGDAPASAQGLPGGAYMDLINGGSLNGGATIPARTALVLAQ